MINSAKSFNEKGYAIIKSKEIIKLKQEICQEIKKIIFFFLKKKNIKIQSNIRFEELIKFILTLDKKKKTKIFKSLYEIFPSIPLFYSLSNKKIFYKICHKLNIKKPVIGTGPQIRIDKPKDKKYITPNHQDYWYSFLSDNAVTFWFNLTSVKLKDGPLIIYEKSHNKGLLGFNNKHKATFEVKEKQNFQQKKIYLKKNEILVFNQFLVHKSGTNISKKPRISIQIRYNDLLSLKKNTSSFIFFNSKYVVNKQLSLQ